MESECVPTGLITSFGNQECERVPDRFCLLSQVGGLCAGGWEGCWRESGGGGGPRDGRGGGARRGLRASEDPEVSITVSSQT